MKNLIYVLILLNFLFTSVIVHGFKLNVFACFKINYVGCEQFSHRLPF